MPHSPATSEGNGEEPALISVAAGSLQVSYRNRFLYSREDPHGGAIRRARAVPVPPQTLILVPSPLLGYGLAELLERCPASSHVLCLEADSRLSRLTEAHVTPRLLDSARLTWLPDATLDGLRRTMTRIEPGRFRRVKLVSLSGGFSLNASWYRHALRQCEADMRIHWQNKMTRIRMGSLWRRNLICNLTLLGRAHRIEELSTDKPVAVVGAGPSLDCLVDVIRSQRDRLCVVAVDTALAALTARGIVPDLVVVVESQRANVIDFLGQLDESYNVAGDLTAHPATLRHVPPERLFLFVSHFHENRLFDRLQARDLLPPLVPALGSVGVVAVHIALSMSDETVYLCGLDFAYYEEKTHARGAPQHLRQLLALHRLERYGGAAAIRWAETPARRKECPEGGSDHLYTDPILHSYAEQLGSIVSRNPGKIVDVTPAGLPVGAPVVCDPGEWADRLAEAQPGEAAGARRPSAAGARQPSAAAPATDETGRPGDASATPDTRAGFTPDTLAAFIGDELELLEEVEKKGRAVIAESETPFADASGAAYREFRGLAGECDYLYMDFPDTGEIPNNSISFVSRVTAAADHLIRRFRRLYT